MRRHGETRKNKDDEVRGKPASELTTPTTSGSNKKMQYVNSSRAKEEQSKFISCQIAIGFIRGFLKFKLFKILALLGLVSLTLYALFTYNTLSKDRPILSDKLEEKGTRGNQIISNINIAEEQQAIKPDNNILEKNNGHLQVDGKPVPPVDKKEASDRSNNEMVDKKYLGSQQERKKIDATNKETQKKLLLEEHMRRLKEKQEEASPQHNQAKEDAMIKEQQPNKEAQKKFLLEEQIRSLKEKQQEAHQQHNQGKGDAIINGQQHNKEEPPKSWPNHLSEQNQPKKLEKNQLDAKMNEKAIFENHVLLILTNAATQLPLRNKFELTITSILQNSSIDLNFFIVTDKPSEKYIRDTFNKIEKKGLVKVKYQTTILNADVLANKLMGQVSNIRDNTQAGNHKYYMDSIFYLSVAIHKDVLPSHVKRLVMLDSDLKFATDIKKLFEFFGHFSASNIIGIAHEQQPVYRHLFSLYRSKNKGTLVGDPPPNGLTGFNSGVMLLDLEKMRASTTYNNYILKDGAVKALTEKYHFKGHLGDQDFYTLLSLEHEDLFHVLPCSYNRQLCQWWRDKGYQSVFDQYFLCPDPIKIYHGNCNTPIP